MSERPVLDTNSLKRNGITFDETVMAPKEVCELLGVQAKTLAKQLLDFRRFVPQGRVKILQSSKYRSRKDGLRRDITNPQQLKQLIINGKLQRKALKANKKALAIVAKTEERWMELVKETLFKEIKGRARDREGEGTISVDEMESWLRVEGNDTWSASHKVLARTTPSSAPQLTRPKPDLYISLPIVQASRVPKSRRHSFSVINFSLRKLQRLESEKGLKSCPLKLLGGDDVDEKYRVCFPGFILEAKHHLPTESNKVKAYCQAANGAANALALSHNLIAGDPYFIDDDWPVVALTLLGHKARLWIAGITSERKKSEIIGGPRGQKTRRYIRVKYHMQCIWEGDLHREDPTAELVCIIDNLEQWMIKDFRPWVSDRITEYKGDKQWGTLEDEDTDSEESNYQSSTDDSEEQTDEEDSDEYWNSSGSEGESESGLDTDDEDRSEYERDLNRVDSYMEELSFQEKVPHRFIQARKERGV